MCRTAFFLISVVFGLYAQTPLVSINGNVTSLENFENSQSNNLQQLGVQKALELYAEFELINQYAIDEGAEQDLEFLQPYQKALIALKNDHIIDPDVLNAALNEFYKKLEYEYKIQLLYAKESQVEVIQNSINKGEDFTALIHQYSLVKDYEKPKYIEYYKLNDEAFDQLRIMQTGKISKPIMFNEGYVWIKKISQRPNLGLVKLQQLVNSDKSIVQKAHTEVEKGGNFSDLIDQYSSVGKSNSGVLPDVITGIPDPVYDAIKNLKVGDYSEVFFDDGKYYMMRLLKHVPLQTMEERRKVLLPIFEISEQYSNLYDANLKKIDTVKTYKLYPDNIKEIISNATVWYADSTRYQTHQKPLFQLGNYQLTQEEMLKKIKASNIDSISANIMDVAIGDNLYNAKRNYYENVLIYQEPRMRPLIDSLKKSLLINYAFDKLILKRSFTDEEGMQEYISENPERFTLPNRALLTNYNCVNQSVAEDVQKKIKTGESSDAIIAEYNNKVDSRNRPFIYLQKGKVSQKSSEFPQNVPFKVGIYINSLEDGRYLVSDISEIIPSQLMTVQEARSHLLDEYQTIYYKKTLDDLKEVAKIEYNPDAVNQLQKKYKK